MNKLCPWCKKSLSLSRPGAYRTDEKWNGIAIHPKWVLVCPHCNNKIAPDPKSKRWFILMLPLLGILLWRAWTMEHWTNWFQNIGWVEWLSVLLAIIGATMEALTSAYVKAK